MSKGDKFSGNNEILREVIEERDIEQKSFEESKTTKPKDEELAALEFARVWKMPDDEEDESYKLLRDRINRQKMEELFDEPSSFEDDNDDPDC